MRAPTALAEAAKEDAEMPALEDVEEQMEEEEEEEQVMKSAEDGRAGEKMEEDAAPPAGKSQSDGHGKPRFRPARKAQRATLRGEARKVSIPPHRMSPLKQSWQKIYPPLVEHLKLQVRMNVKAKAVELRTSKYTDDTGSLQKGADFLTAFALGFDVDDATALLRLDDLYLETFEIKDVKTLHGEHLSRAIGRIAGKDGKTKFAIENASRTRIVLADAKIHILGGFSNIKIARESVARLIMGAPPGKVYGNLGTIAARMKERY